MSKSALKQIRSVIEEHDVRDPRGALLAIENILAQPKAEKPKRYFRIDIGEGPLPDTLASNIDHADVDDEFLRNLHEIAIKAIELHAEDHGTPCPVDQQGRLPDEVLRINVFKRDNGKFDAHITSVNVEDGDNAGNLDKMVALARACKVIDDTGTQLTKDNPALVNEILNRTKEQ